MDSFTKNQVATMGVAIANEEFTQGKREIVLTAATDIFNDRNSKYKDAWRDYRYSTFVDRNLVKAKRLRSLDEAGDKFEMFEQALDQINELAFLAILLAEDISKNEVRRIPITFDSIGDKMKDAAGKLANMGAGIKAPVIGVGAEKHVPVPPMAEVNAIKEEQEDK